MLLPRSERGGAVGNAKEQETQLRAYRAMPGYLCILPRVWGSARAPLGALSFLLPLYTRVAVLSAFKAQSKQPRTHTTHAPPAGKRHYSRKGGP